jgi:murein DD-endopeptidase MepM/ murein hydrolase activator NlpD
MVIKEFLIKYIPSTHLGNDFRAPEGTPIPTSNTGKVVYVGDLFYSGKTVIVDHGMQLFSMYAHLSKISVAVGATVNRGDIVGLSGATGRASGPHLHWGIKINGEWIDGFSLVEEYNALELKN